jgi:hypothetical protein
MKMQSEIPYYASDSSATKLYALDTTWVNHLDACSYFLYSKSIFSEQQLDQFYNWQSKAYVCVPVS